MNGQASRPPSQVSPQVHVDDVRLVVRQVTYPTGDPADVTAGLFCTWDQLGVSLEEAANLSASVAWDDDEQAYGPFVAEQTYTHHSWGADATGVTFIVNLASNVSADMIIAGMAYAVGRIRGKAASRAKATVSEDLDETKRLAIEAVAAIFDEPWDELHVTEVVIVDPGVRLALTGRSDTYECSVGRLKTGDIYVHARRLVS